MKLRIFLRSFNNKLIKLATEQINNNLVKEGYIIKNTIALPTRIKRFCVLRSPHVDKDSREHFEIRSFKRFFDIETNLPSILDCLLKIELPSGVACSLKIL